MSISLTLIIFGLFILTTPSFLVNWNEDTDWDIQLIQKLSLDKFLLLRAMVQSGPIFIGAGVALIGIM